MTITLTPDQERWLLAQVSAGDFSSVEEAVRWLIDERMAWKDRAEIDDMAWVGPLVEEGLLAYEAGDTISYEEHRARNQARLTAMMR